MDKPRSKESQDPVAAGTTSTHRMQAQGLGFVVSDDEEKGATEGLPKDLQLISPCGKRLCS